jgi:hypothetical protein
MFIVQQRELFKDEIARMVKDSERNVRYLIESIHHHSELRKDTAEKLMLSSIYCSSCQAQQPDVELITPLKDMNTHFYITE